MSPTIIGALRVRNESRWIRQVIRSIAPVCNRILVLDDNSDDDTGDICRSEGCAVFKGAVPWVDNGAGLISDETAGKQYLLDRICDGIAAEDQHYLNGNPDSPYWVLAVDGDEELVSQDAAIIRASVAIPGVHAWSLHIQYLWNNSGQWRTDGVYGDFRRPSLFRLMNRAFTYKKTPWGNGANFHCSSIPQELIGHSKPCTARLLHWGYLDRADRLRKYAWYNRVDPNNQAEDCYRHMVQGDIPEIPPDARLRWAGPLKVEQLTSA